MLRYIRVTVPSAGENKCTVLRNVVGAIGCMPKDSGIRFDVLLFFFLLLLLVLLLLLPLLLLLLLLLFALVGFKGYYHLYMGNGTFAFCTSMITSSDRYR